MSLLFANHTILGINERENQLPEGKRLPNQDKCFECGFRLRNRTYSKDLKRAKEIVVFQFSKRQSDHSLSQTVVAGER